MTRRLLLLAASAVLAMTSAMWTFAGVRADDDMAEAQKEVAKAAEVFQEIMNAPDKGISKDLLERAECVAVFPNVINAAFIVGGRGGDGVVSCRDQAGNWSAPVFLELGGGSVGFQIGAESIDLILLGMNRASADFFTKERFELGGEASAAAGPVGRTAGASTDLPTIDSQFLSYSRTKGAFAGIALKGTVIKRDDGLNAVVYGPTVSTGEVLGGRQAPNEIGIFQQTLARYSTRRGTGSGAGTGADRDANRTTDNNTGVTGDTNNTTGTENRGNRTDRTTNKDTNKNTNRDQNINKQNQPTDPNNRTDSNRNTDNQNQKMNQPSGSGVKGDGTTNQKKNTKTNRKNQKNKSGNTGTQSPGSGHQGTDHNPSGSQPQNRP